MAIRNKSSLKTRLKPLGGHRLKKTAKLSLLAASLLYGSNALAFGLGTLEVSSNLDQPLSGRIELKVEPSDDLSNLTAVIAPREDFDTLGLEYPEYLKDIEIIVDRLGTEPALVISSNGVVIKEPFINFLVRVEWAGGSFLREYTALIDPPVYAAEAPQAISEPKSVGTDETFVEDLPAYTEPASPEISDIVDDSLDDVESSETEPLVEDSYYANGDINTDEAEIVETLEQQGVETGASIPTDAQYGPILRGESLSMIAQELQGQFPDLSIYQIMRVLFDENPQAFISGNINGLIQGSLLRVGDLDAIRAVDIEDGRAFFQEQLAAWDSSGFSNSGSSSDSISVDDDSYNFDSSIAADADSSTDSLFAEDSAAEESFQVGSSSETSDLVSADQSGNREGEVLALRDEITNLEASLASSNLENQELTERISILEGQLADMNRLLELGVENAGLSQVESALAEQNSEELADVDDSIDEFLTNTESTTEQEGVDDLDSLLADVSGDISDPGDETVSSIDEFLSDGESTVDVDDALADIDSGVSADLDVGADDISLDALESTVVDDSVASITEPDSETVAPITNASNTSSSAAESEGFIAKMLNSLKSSGIWKIVAGVGALLAAAFALLFIRRRRADEEFEVSMLSIESNSQTIDTAHHSDDTTSLSATQSATAASVTESPDKETSFLTVYSDSDAVVQADEVDPVAEADVYIAYGRNEQAEEVLLDGVSSQPGRADIKFKLLTLYHKSNNVGGYERIAEELYSSGTAPSDMWQEVVTMGQEVSPSNPLFNLSATDIEMAEDMNSEISIEGEDVSEELTPVAVDDSVELKDANLGEEFSVEDESNLLSVNDESASPETIEPSLDDAVDALSDKDSVQLVDFDDGGSEVSELDEHEIDAISDTLLVDSQLDGDLSGELDTVVDDSNVVQLLADDEENSIDVDMDDESLEFNAPSEGTFSENDTADEEGERSIREVQEVSDLEIDSDYDESRTQYELAKVFVDLGDEDGAKRILNELVANDDNDEEVLSDARELLKSIS